MDTGTFVSTPRKADSVAIVGFADGHRDMAPFDQDGWEYWGLNRLHAVMPDRPWTRWFEVHDLQQFYRVGTENEDSQHREFLRGFGGPVYLRPQDIGVWDIPNAEPYPINDMLNLFVPYFTNSIAYLLALAIALEFKKIALYGVDMAQDTLMQAEYAEQRPSCEFFLGVAVGRGIEIELPVGSDLLKASHLYGLENPDPIWAKNDARLQELAARKQNVQQQVAQLDAQRGQSIAGINQLEGAIAELTYQRRNLSPSKQE